MPEHLKVEVSKGQRGVPVAAKLTEGGGLTVKSNIPGRIDVLGSKACRNKTLPLEDCPLPNGKYTVRIDSSRPDGRKEFAVVIKGNEVTENVQFGFVQSAEGFKILKRGRSLKRIAIDEGQRTVTVVNDETGERKEVTVRVQAGRTVTAP